MTLRKDVGYPSQYESEVLLKDGSRILLRPIRCDDIERWLDFVKGLSPETKYLRLHYHPNDMTEEDAIRFCTVDYENNFAFVAEVMKKKHRDIVAIGRYYRLPDRHSAEIAFVVGDAYHGKGIGTKLVERLADVARENDITTFEADVLADNKQMLNIFRDFGFHLSSELEEDKYHVSFSIARTRSILKKEEERERTSTLASLRSVLYPRSVAVIGASRKSGAIGQLVFQAIMQSGFSGVVYPVNPSAESIMAVKAYPSIFDIPDDVELAIIVVPAQLVTRVADECGRKGVRAIIVISDGFRERGTEGMAREKELREITLGHGMRLVGPNCMGVINTDPGVSMNGTFSRVYPPRGNIGFLSQSGAMGLVILEHAHNLNIGISTFVSVGNRADISSNDLLQYWEQDPGTKVILLYLESFGNPKKFGRIARRVSATKPIVAVKGGSTVAGSRAASSHTGALATSEIFSDALFQQAGIIRVNSVGELFDVATLFSNQPIPRGKRLAIITNGGGPGTIAADVSERFGLVLPEFTRETVNRLKTIIKRDVSYNNPLDMTAGASAEEFAGVLRVMAEDPTYDAVLTIFIPPTVTDPTAMEDVIRRVSPQFQHHKKPLTVCFMGQKGTRGKLGSAGNLVPSYLFPEDAISALTKAAEYGEMLRQPKGAIPKISGIRRRETQKMIKNAMTRSDQRPLWLSAQEISLLLGCYGIPVVETKVTKTPIEAADAAVKAGFPVAVKLDSATIVHKTDVGGVVLNLGSKSEVERAFRNIKNKLAGIGRENEMDGVTVQHMVEGGIESLVGVTQDPSFGPLIMFGLGGIYAELFQDVAVRLHPLTDLDARKLVRSIKMARLFKGFRGAPARDVQALEDLLLRLSALVEDIPEVAELDLNPVMLMAEGEGCWVVDARIMLR